MFLSIFSLQCAPGTRKLQFKFRRGSYLPYYPDQYTGCVGGCDPLFLEILGINLVTRNTRTEQGKNLNLFLRNIIIFFFIG